MALRTIRNTKFEKQVHNPKQPQYKYTEQNALKKLLSRYNLTKLYKF